MKQRNTIISAIIILFMLSAGSVMGQFWSSNANGIHYNSGNVGIGTNAPSQLLHLNNTEGKAAINIDGSQPTIGNSAMSQVVFNDLTGSNMFVNALRKYNGNIEFVQSCYISSSSTWATIMRFYYNNAKWQIQNGVSDIEYLNSGNILLNNAGGVLINTSYIPSGYHLAVGGKIIAEEVLVELQTAWPDYVFNPDYNLPSISEVDSFIKENNHLPGVPSQSEISEEGIRLGKMNEILLKKIEELTLYIIQQDERIKHLEEQINK
jgi:hypothetical protein